MTVRLPVLLSSLLVACLAVAGCGGHEAPADAIPEGVAGGVTAKDGIRIGFAIQPVDGAADQRLVQGSRARLSLRVTDEAAGEGLAGLHLGAWLVPRPSGAPAPDEKATRNMVRKLMAAKLGAGASTNLNAYFFVTLNTDRTVAMLDPLLDFTRTRMKNILSLPGKGADLVFGPADHLLFVSLPDRGEVLVADATTMTMVKTVKAGKAPRRLVRQPVSGRVWASDDSGDRAFVLDGRTGDRVDAVEVGPGPKLFAFDQLGRYAFVATRDAGRLIVYRTEDGKATPLVALDTAITGMTYAQAARALYVSAAGGAVDNIDPESGERRRVQTLPAESGPLWATDDGRWVFVADRAGSRVHVIDTSTNQPPRAITTGAVPSQVVFTNGFAHVYCAGSRHLTLIQLSALSQAGAVPALSIPIGQDEPGRRDPDAVGEFIAVTPDDSSVLMLVPEEKRIYHYVEGMMAPRGSYQNYSREPLSLAVMDRSLRDVGNGDYTVTLGIDYAGTVDLFVYLNQPTQFFAHFAFQVEPDPQLILARKKNTPLAVPVPITPTTRLPVRETAQVRFRLIDPQTREDRSGRKDVRILIHAMRGNWQRRLPAVATEDGQYVASLAFQDVGEYQFHVQCPSLKLAYGLHRALKLTVTDDIETSSGSPK